ncbi:1465_t:CDS:2 [Cetraspora pellucida]|uniref:1465_t:CDS:1 n=1 Tax=Cetraspora pellucida TaxID=1433469 RepID=A0A9N9HI02_9GLOM|nr:1465_t:CDS:2 [Cetraspora pellucida]
MVNTYLNLIYEEVKSKENESNEFNNNISTAGTCKQWQYLKDTNQVEYLPSVTTDDLLCKVQATIYLSLDEL